MDIQLDLDITSEVITTGTLPLIVSKESVELYNEALRRGDPHEEACTIALVNEGIIMSLVSMMGDETEEHF